MKHPRRTLRAALALIAAFAAAACGDLATEASSPVQSSPPGTYTLVSINQQGLPYATTSDGSSGVRIASGQMILGNTGSFEQILVFVGPTNSQALSPTQGTYEASGDRIIFRVSSGATFGGTLTMDGRLEYVVQGNYGPLAFRFQRT